MFGSDPGGACSRALSSMSMPSKLRKVSASRIALRTSSNRVSAHQPHCSLRKTGASFRIRRYTSNGSEV